MDLRRVLLAFFLIVCVSSKQLSSMKNEKLLKKVLSELQDLVHENEAEAKQQDAKKEKEVSLTEKLVKEYNLQDLRTDAKFGENFMAFIHRIQAWINGNSNDNTTAAAEDDTEAAPSAPSDQSTEPEESQDKPTETEFEAKPTGTESEAKPTETESEAIPAESESEAKPTKPESEAKPTKPESEAKPTKPESEAKPAVLESEAKPTETESEAKPTKPDSEAKPSVSESEAKPAESESPKNPSLTTNTNDDQQTKEFKSQLRSLLDTFMKNKKAQKEGKAAQMKPADLTRMLDSVAPVDKERDQTQVTNIQKRNKIDSLMSELDDLIDSIKARDAAADNA